jgi:hypothetical protein
MAVAHIAYNHGSQHGAILHGALIQFENSFETINNLKETMTLMIDGDGSQAAHFTYMTDKFGFADDATAKAGYDELASVLFKLNTNSSVSDVNAAILQVLNKFR